MDSVTGPAVGSGSPLDDALDKIHTAHLEYGRGLSDHAPMVVEALDLIGRSDKIEAWLADYAPRLDSLGTRDEPDELMWVERLDSEMAVRSWRAVVLDRVPHLADATAAAAGHGLLRTAHAVRGLMRSDTASRRSELARALAYWEWCAEHTGDIIIRGGRPPLDVLGDAAAPASPAGDGLISARLRHVVTPAFLASIEAVDLATNVAADPASALTRITSVAASCLASAPPAGHFALLHGLTSSIAARDLLELLPPADQRRIVSGIWTTVAALWAGYGEGTTLTPAKVDEPPDSESLVDRAVAFGDEHAIKVAVSVWSEEKATGDRPEIRAAVAATLDWFGA